MGMFYLILIVVSFVLLIPIVYGLLLPVVKPSLTSKGSIYLNAFVSGFFLILGIFGFLNDAREELLEHGNPSWIIFLILFFSVAFALFSSLGIRFLLAKYNNKKEFHSLREHHHHDNLVFNSTDVKMTNKKLKIFPLLLLLSHRIPGGFIIGFLIHNVIQEGTIDIESLVFLITFVLHIIPEELIFYYRQIDSGISKWVATRNSIFGILLLVPFIFAGAYGTEAISNEYFIAFMNASVGGFFIFVSLIELIPEFLHEKMDGKTWYITIIFLIIGILCAVAILSFHSHPEAHEH